MMIHYYYYYLYQPLGTGKARATMIVATSTSSQHRSNKITPVLKPSQPVSQDPHWSKNLFRFDTFQKFSRTTMAFVDQLGLFQDSFAWLVG